MSKMIDETGNRYGSLVVIEAHDTRRFGNVVWVCKCDCGNTKPVVGTYLRNGNTKTCGCCIPKDTDEVGNIYGRLAVVSLAGRDSKKNIMWLCKCSCGNTMTTRGTSLRFGHVNSCGCLAKERRKSASALPEGEASFNRYIYAVKRAARTRDLEWDLANDQVKEINARNCFYCGREPSQKYAAPRTNGPHIYNGIDRLDNNRGYTIDNVVPCCGQCNIAKHNHTVSEFSDWISRVYNHWARFR